ncbi:hypothetical protein LZ269_24215 [Streptomyces lomondensis]|nr:hypothetical protein [Streptomyces lomondensis]
MLAAYFEVATSGACLPPRHGVPGAHTACGKPCPDRRRVVVQGGGRDRGIDITALTADGRRIVVQCKRFAPHLSITSPVHR